jgi:hypothetical protein
MGYRTRYNLEIFKNKSDASEAEVKEKLLKLLANYDVLDYAIDEDLDGCDSVKWYEHNNNMKEISKELKDVVLKLRGVGGENGDIWDKYYLNGKVQKCNAEIVIPEFDEGKLS